MRYDGKILKVDKIDVLISEIGVLLRGSLLRTIIFSSEHVPYRWALTIQLNALRLYAAA